MSNLDADVYRRGSSGRGSREEVTRQPRQAVRRPSADISLSELYAPPDAENQLTIEYTSTYDGQTSENPLLIHTNPRARVTSSTPLAPPQTAEQKQTAQREERPKNQSKQDPETKSFRFSMLLGWTGMSGKKGKIKKEDNDKSVARPVLPPSFSFTTSKSQANVERTNQPSQPPKGVYDPNIPLLRFISEEITVAGQSKLITISTQSDAFAKAVVLSMEAVSAARDMHKAEPSNDAAGYLLVMELEALADIYKSFGDFNFGMALLQESIAVRKKHNIGNEQDLAVALNDLALLYCEVERYTDAFPLFQQAHALSESHNGGPCPDSAACIGNAGVALRGAKIFADAIVANDQAYTQMAAMTDCNHFNSLQQKAMLAMSLYGAGDPGLGTRMLKEVVEELKNQEYSEDHPYLKCLEYEYKRFINDADSE